MNAPASRGARSHTAREGENQHWRRAASLRRGDPTGRATARTAAPTAIRSTHRLRLADRPRRRVAPRPAGSPGGGGTPRRSTPAAPRGYAPGDRTGPARSSRTRWSVRGQDADRRSPGRRSDQAGPRPVAGASHDTRAGTSAPRARAAPRELRERPIQSRRKEDDATPSAVASGASAPRLKPAAPGQRAPPTPGPRLPATFRTESYTMPSLFPPARRLALQSTKLSKGPDSRDEVTGASRGPVRRTTHSGPAIARQAV